jgi:hypothetical protein
VGDKRRCWKCGTVYSLGETVCPRCGIDLQSGKKVQPGTLPETPPVEDPATARERWIARLMSVLPGLLRPGLLALSLLTALLGFAVLGLGFALLMLAPVSAVGIAGVGLALYAQAVAWMVLGDLQLLSSALAEFDGRRWTVFWTILCASAAAAFGVARILFPPPA